MDFFTQAWDIITNLQDHLARWTAEYGSGIYYILAAVIFCETGLVVMPFLPGDSLLFATGALCSPEIGNLSILKVCIILPIAAILGDSVNYWVGRYFGPRVFKKQKSIFFNTEILHKTQQFYDKHGRKMVILARFVPLIRTFAPFVAGVGRMNYGIFLGYGILGAFFWVGVCAGAGYIWGNTEWVKKNFELMILAVIFISILPAVFAWWASRRDAKLEAKNQAATPSN